LIDEITYYRKFKGNKSRVVEEDLSRSLYFIREINQMCNQYAQTVDEKYKEDLNNIVQRTAIYGSNGQ
jgi:hypothetical protein